jgi:hypothetical protein
VEDKLAGADETTRHAQYSAYEGGEPFVMPSTHESTRHPIVPLNDGRAEDGEKQCDGETLLQRCM